MIGEKMKSTSIKKIISCTLTSTFSLGTTLKVNAIDSYEINSIKNKKVR